MFWPTHRSDSEGNALSRPGYRGIALGTVGAVVLGGILTGAALVTPRSAGADRPGAVYQDTLRHEDLRCLTRRPDDCLPAPVPQDEPHGAICATCHDMWSQDVPADVTRSCTEAGCHSGALALSTFHETVHPEALADCLHCHKAHDFRVPESGNECTVCHRGGGEPVEWVDASSSRPLTAPAPFTHNDHTPVACGRCHGAGDAHGTLAVASLNDCRSCHHQPPVANDCTRCHERSQLAGTVYRVTRSLNITIGSLDHPLRLLPFDHGKHPDIECTQCHTEGTTVPVADGADCSTCHLEHHAPTADCGTCHAEPAPGAHDAEAHMGCGGVGCHDPVPEGIEYAPRTRQLCLACHTDRADHKADRTCADCHKLPSPTGLGR